MNQKKKIALISVLVIPQILYFILPLGTDGIHGNSFLISDCEYFSEEINERSLRFTQSFAIIGVLATLGVMIFKELNRMLALIAIVFVSQILVYLSFMTYYTYHANPCHEKLYMGVASCDGWIEYSTSRFLPFVTALMAIVIFMYIFKPGRKRHITR